MLFFLLFFIAVLFGISALLFYGVGLSELHRPFGKPHAVALADFYFTVGIGIEQFMIVATWMIIYRCIFEWRRSRE